MLNQIKTNMKTPARQGFLAFFIAVFALLISAGVCLPAAPTQALAADAQSVYTEKPANYESITFNCTYCYSEKDKKEYGKSGKYIILNNDGTGTVAHRTVNYYLKSWSLDGTSFKATDHMGETMTGTLGSDNVLSVQYRDYQYKYRLGDDAAIMNLSPSTWFHGLPYVFDEAGLLTKDQVTALEAKAKAVSDKYQCGVYVVTVQDMTTYCKRNNIDAFAEEILFGYQLGYGKDKDCIVLVLSMKERDFALISYGPKGKDKYFDAAAREWVMDKVKVPLKDNKWNEAFNMYVDKVDFVCERRDAGIPLERPAPALHIGLSVLISLLIAFVIGNIISRILRSRMKSVSAAVQAKEYSAPEGAKITDRSDTYTRTTTSRRYSPQADDDSGGGSSSHTSSSGVGHTSGKF